VFWLFYNDNFIVLTYDLYFRIERNIFNLSLDEIECDFVTYVC